MAAPPPNVLLIDDDALVRDTFRAFFDSLGWRYQLLADSRQSVDAVNHGDFDVVVTDLMMPYVDGIQAIKELKKNRPSLAAMVVTGMGDYEAVLKSLKAGAVDYFTKPLNFQEFKDAIERVTKKRREGTSGLGRFLASFNHSYSMSTAEAAGCALQFPEVEQLAKCRLIDEALKLKITLALQEAFSNCVEHGNLELQSEWREELCADGTDKFFKVKQERLDDPRYSSRRIEISSSLADGVFKFRIKDEGPGFSPKVTRIENPTPGELNSYGRGIRIIADTMDTVEYLDRGREIIMLKRVGEANGAKV